MNNPYELAEQLRKAADSIEWQHVEKVASQFECDAGVLRQFEWILKKSFVSSPPVTWHLWAETPKGEKANKLFEQCREATTLELNAFESRMRDEASPRVKVAPPREVLGFYNCLNSELYEILAKFGPLEITNIKEAVSVMQSKRDACDEWDELLVILGAKQRLYSDEALRAQLREARGLLRDYMEEDVYERYIKREFWRTLLKGDSPTEGN